MGGGGRAKLDRKSELARPLSFMFFFEERVEERRYRPFYKVILN